MFCDTRSILVRLILLLVVVSAVPASTGAEERRLDLDAMLKVGGFGAALIDPEGRRVVFEQIQPYDEIEDYGYRLHAFGRAGHRIWLYDRAQGGPARLLFEQEPGVSYYLHAFSPDGSRLALFQYQDGRLVLAVYDFRKAALVEFASTPALSRNGLSSPVWVTNDLLAFTALPDGQQPDATSIRVHLSRKAAASREAAWKGREVTARIRTTSGMLGAMPETEAGSLVIGDARTGAIRQLAAGSYSGLQVSADGHFLAALEARAGPVLDASGQPADDRFIYQLKVFDRDGGTVAGAPPGLAVLPQSLVWDPFRSRLAFLSRTEGASPDEGIPHILDVVSGDLASLPQNGLDILPRPAQGWRRPPPQLAFLGEGLAIYAKPVGTPSGAGAAAGEANWYLLAAHHTPKILSAGIKGIRPQLIQAGRGHITVQGDEGVFRLFPDGERVAMAGPVTTGLQYRPSMTLAARQPGAVNSSVNEALFTIAGSGDAGQYLLVDLRDRAGAATRFQAGAPAPALLAGSAAAGVTVIQVQNGARTQLLLAGAEGSVSLAAVNTHLEGIGLGQWKTVEYPAPEASGAGTGARIESCVLLPPRFLRGEPPPLVIEVYPGARPGCLPEPPAITTPDPHSPYLWAGLGFTYARVTLPLDMLPTEEGPIGAMPALVDAAADAIIAAGYGNPDAQILTGFSQGGVSALYTAARTDRFQAVIALNSWADYSSHYFGGLGEYAYADNYGASAQFRRYEAEGSEFNMSASPFGDPAKYFSGSPVFLAPQVTSPVLLFHSDLDGFPMSQFDAMYAALLRAGKDATYVQYIGEGHGPSSPANIRHMWACKLAFFRAAGIPMPEGSDHRSACVR